MHVGSFETFFGNDSFDFSLGRELGSLGIEWVVWAHPVSILAGFDLVPRRWLNGLTSFSHGCIVVGAYEKILVQIEMIIGNYAYLESTAGGAAVSIPRHHAPTTRAREIEMSFHLPTWRLCKIFL